MVAIGLAERRLLPDSIIRLGIRQLLRRRLRSEFANANGRSSGVSESVLSRLRGSPITIETDAANEQHYEVPAAFFEHVLGSRMKYSCGYWDDAETTLDESEEAMLALSCRRAEIENGMEILELGCGWGSATLWIAEQFPQCRVLGVSNSASQREFILNRARRRGLDNVDVVTCDVARFDTSRRFDRVVSVEMFEHVRNHESLMRNISNWLHPQGKLFVHVFCHRQLAYFFETEGEANWMGRHFFTGGIMPSQDLLPCFQDDVKLSDQWQVSGNHYARTCEAWLRRLDEQKAQVAKSLQGNSGVGSVDQQIQRWRMFFMACAELFRFGGGDEWFVSHYLFEQR